MCANIVPFYVRTSVFAEFVSIGGGGPGGWDQEAKGQSILD